MAETAVASAVVRIDLNRIFVFTRLSGMFFGPDMPPTLFKTLQNDGVLSLWVERSFPLVARSETGTPQRQMVSKLPRQRQTLVF
jgi:hypothetical protein